MKSVFFDCFAASGKSNVTIKLNCCNKRKTSIQIPVELEQKLLKVLENKELLEKMLFLMEISMDTV